MEEEIPQAFAVALIILGAGFDIADIFAIIDLFKVSPLPGHLFELGLGIAFIFAVGTMMFLWGLHIFRHIQHKIK
jgi:hypothetical protein